MPIIFVVLLCLKKESTENKTPGKRLWFMHHLKQSGAFRQLTVFSPSPNRCFLFITSCFQCPFLYLLFPKEIHFVLHSGFVKRYCVGLWSRLKPLMRLSVELAAQNFKLEVSNPPLCFSIPLSEVLPCLRGHSAASCKKLNKYIDLQDQM